VLLNVGGCEYAELDTVLANSPPGVLARMFSASSPYTLMRDAHGRVFIGADGEAFAAVLGYLRRGVALVPTTLSRARVQLELNYFFDAPAPLALTDDMHRFARSAELRALVAAVERGLHDVRAAVCGGRATAVGSKAWRTDPLDVWYKVFWSSARSTVVRRVAVGVKPQAVYSHRVLDDALVHLDGSDAAIVMRAASVAKQWPYPLTAERADVLAAHVRASAVYAEGGHLIAVFDADSDVVVALNA
jgi:hypothetical protein